MKFKSIMLVAVAAISSSLAVTSTALAAQTSLPGTGCKLVTGNWVQVSGTTFLGTELTNNSSSTLYAICPLQLEYSYHSSIQVTGNANAFPAVCSLFYSYSANSFTFISGTTTQTSTGKTASWSGIGAITAASIDCPMGPGSVLYQTLITD